MEGIRLGREHHLSIAKPKGLTEDTGQALCDKRIAKDYTA